MLLELLNQAEQIVIDTVLKLLESSEGNATEKVVAFLHHQSLLGVSDRENMLLIILMSLEFEEVRSPGRSRRCIASSTTGSTT